MRTVQRWEQTENLPIHRIVHEKRSTVYAYRKELDQWWRSRQASKSGRLTLPEQDAVAEAPSNRIPEPRSSHVKLYLLLLGAVAAVAMALSALRS